MSPSTATAAATCEPATSSLDRYTENDSQPAGAGVLDAGGSDASGGGEYDGGGTIGGDGAGDTYGSTGGEDTAGSITYAVRPSSGCVSRLPPPFR